LRSIEIIKAFIGSPSRKLRKARVVSASLLSDSWDVFQ